MPNEKKSFVLYFDMYPMVAELSKEQKGELFDALFQFAGRVVEEDDPEVPQDGMLPETRMAFHFMSQTIWRDTMKWREKHERYKKAARSRVEKKMNEDEMSRYVRALAREEPREP